MYVSRLKLIVARRVLEDYTGVLREADVLGIGTGSTVRFFIDEMIRLGLHRGKKLVVSSMDTLFYLAQKGIHAYTPHIIGSIDVYVDGFDEASTKLDLVKGRGAALLWEKQLALRAEEKIYIGDYTKYTGRNYLYKKPVPVEVVPAAIPYVMEKLKEFGEPVLRPGKARDGPVVTDSGNYIVDLVVDRIDDAVETDRMIRLINGVVETGIFPRILVDRVYIAFPDGSVKVFEAGD